MKCMKEKGLEAYQVKRNLKKNLKNPWGTSWSEIRVFLGEKTEKCRERYQRKWELDRTGCLYRTSSKSRQMQVSRGIEGSVDEVSRKCSSTAEVSRRHRGTTHQNQEQKLDQSTKCQEAIEEAGAFDWSTKYQGGVEERSIKCKNRSSIYPPAVEKLSRRQELSRSIHLVSMRCRDCVKKKKMLKKLDR